MDVELKYGKGMISVHLPETADSRVLEPNEMSSLPSIPEALQEELAGLAGKDGTILPGPGCTSVAIAIPDETRPLPVGDFLPVLLDWLFVQLPDIDPAMITVVIGGGLHPPLDDETCRRIVPPDLARGCRVLSHDANNSPMDDFGRTSWGTPVLVNREISQADYKIVVGQIDPHQFVGFTGGSKGVVIGCGGAATIEHNHGLMFQDNAVVGVLHGNPVREDINEAGEMIGVDLAVNCVMSPSKEVVEVLAGRPLDTLQNGAKTCADLYGVYIDRKFDILIASCGGYPKDICLYQAQKGLNMASRAVKKGGKILLLAAATKGVGDDVYFDYVSQFTSPEEVLADFKKQGFRMGAHKAYLFGSTLSQYDVAICSEMDPGILQKCHLRAADPSRVIADWVETFSGRPKIGIIPNANTTYFYGLNSTAAD
ncbi:MAG: nickel-dependent lactate racemase [Desulfopila sp.]|jgi:nickel-dependent lactate racemase|nr:nickel-dependent lactate racemase [Desulfopila sp.]